MYIYAYIYYIHASIYTFSICVFIVFAIGRTDSIIAIDISYRL